MNKKQLNKGTVMIISFLLLILALLLAIGIGSVYIPVQDVVKTIFQGAQDDTNRTILFDVRLPRALVAIIVGINIAIAGALLQAVMGNPLADPGLTGVTTGAAMFVLFIMLVMPEHTGLIPIAAFIGGNLAAIGVYILAWNNGTLTPVRIILAGVAINAICGGVIGFLSIVYSDRLPTALQWLNGSLAAKGMDALVPLLPYSIAGWFVVILFIRKTNIIRLGDETAANLGESVNAIRIVLSLIAVFLTAISVAVIGVIGFVGLIVPHMGRMLVGSNYKYLIPVSMTLGALTLLIADTIGRTAFAPLDIPAGIFMAIIGGPYFLYLMKGRVF